MNIEIDISNVIIVTKRLVLRPWRLSDLDDLFEYAKVDGVGQMAGWCPHKDKKESLAILNMFIDEKKTFALEYHGKAIGSLGIEKYNEKIFPEYADLRCREIGFALSKDFWGHGFVPEAVEEVNRWLFEEKKLDAVFGGHFVWNTQSARVQEKCGFRKIGSRKYETRCGTVEDCIDNILTREDWEEHRSKYYS